MTTVAHRLTS